MTEIDIEILEVDSTGIGLIEIEPSSIDVVEVETTSIDIIELSENDLGTSEFQQLSDFLSIDGGRPGDVLTTNSLDGGRA